MPIRIQLDSSHDRAGARGRHRWTFKHRRPAAHYTCDPETRITTLETPVGVNRTWTDPLDALNTLAQITHDPETATGNEPESEQRLVGYLNYDVGRLFESLPSQAPDDLQLPLFEFSHCWTNDHHPPPRQERMPLRCQAVRSNFSRADYLSAVARVIKYIRAGDVYQVNLSQRFTAGCAHHPLQIYHTLRQRTPAEYGAFLDYGDHALISNSPELFLRVEPLPDGRRRVITRPVKGTRPRAPGMDIELHNSKKDQAELAMIVDLARNDLGRVCEVGTVKVIEPRAIEAHPTVYHGVATIEGILRDNATFVDLLRATFPCGSVTGAPKIRAMQIIDELEPVRRGPYCGAIGYLSSTGVIEFNVAIRTMIVRDGLIHIPVGGGIVADSDPAAEYEETLVKAQAMFAAVGIGASEVINSE